MECDVIGTTPAITCGPDMPVEQVGRLMREHNTGYVVVVDAGRRPVGVVTDRDLVLRVLAAGLPATVPVDGAMTHEPVTISVRKDSEDAARHMAQRGCRRLPTIDDDGRVVGVVTFDDLLLRAGHTLEELTRLVEVEQAAEIHLLRSA